MSNIIFLGSYSGKSHNLQVTGVRITYTMRIDIGGGVLFEGEVTDLSAVPFTGTGINAALTANDDGSVNIAWPASQPAVNVRMEPVV